MRGDFVFCCSSCISFNPSSHLSEPKNLQSNRKKYFSLMQLNISSLQYRLEKFSEVTREVNTKFNIACMTAVRLKKYPLTNNILLQIQKKEVLSNPKGLFIWEPGCDKKKGGRVFVPTLYADFYRGAGWPDVMGWFLSHFLSME